MMHRKKTNLYKKILNYNLVIFLLFCQLLFTNVVFAKNEKEKTILTHDYIQNLAEQIVIQQLYPDIDTDLTVKAIPLDKRIKIKSCKTDLNISLPNPRSGAAQTTVLIRCNDATVWSLYIHVKIKHLISIVTAKRAIPTGELISQDAIELQKRDKLLIRGGIIEKPSLIIGAKASKYISRGQSITMQMICMVCKGEKVAIIAESAGLQVKSFGIAQQSGSLGDTIIVLNTKSKRRIEAQVISLNRVKIVL